MMDSSGNQTPSTTPEDISSYDCGAGLSVMLTFSALPTSLMTPPPTRNLMPSRSASVATGRLLLKMAPGPCVNTAMTLRPLCSSSLSRCLSWMRW